MFSFHKQNDSGQVLKAPVSQEPQMEKVSWNIMYSFTVFI